MNKSILVVRGSARKKGYTNLLCDEICNIYKKVLTKQIKTSIIVTMVSGS